LLHLATGNPSVIPHTTLASHPLYTFPETFSSTSPTGVISELPTIQKKMFPICEQYLKTWYDTAMSSDWKSPNEVKKTYVHASILKNNRIVFNIKGNSFRLVAKFNFEKQWVFIKFIGTHVEYNMIDANMI
jgi:mRNA interferase HigB